MLLQAPLLRICRGRMKGKGDCCKRFSFAAAPWKPPDGLSGTRLTTRCAAGKAQAMSLGLALQRKGKHGAASPQGMMRQARLYV